MPTRRLALLLGLLLPAAAMAGDYADRDILGFSTDGGYFAFEEYGTQDGSGFSYSNIYVIDIDKDRWASGTPVRVLRKDESVALTTVRTDARKQGSALLKRYGIVAVGETLVSNPLTEIGADPYVVRFITNPYVDTDRIWTLTLTPVPFPDPPGCENLGPVQGFRLVLRNVDGEERTLLEDSKLPASRGCALDYAISDVVFFDPEAEAAKLAVIVSVYTVGFEGSDRRFLAVTAPLSD